MTRHERHDRDKGREYTGEEHAARVIDLFNIRFRQDAWAGTAQARESKERVLAIFVSISELMEQLRGVKSWPKSPEEIDESLLAYFLELNLQLAQYVATPMLIPISTHPRAIDVRYVPVGQFPDQELDAVTALTHLALLDKVDRIRRCECERWYFLRFAHQRFCSEECRVRFWESSEERKEQKRAQARRNYPYRKAHGKA